MGEPSHRAAQLLTGARRIVVKVGSRALAESPARPDEIAQEVVEATAEGRQVVLVSSGAVALGLGRLGMSGRPEDIARLQAAAAAGQSILMHRYEAAFASRGLVAAQVLLTHDDLADRERFLRARATLEALLALGAVPVVNENDTVAVDEIRFGDNDRLAAMLAASVGAELLVLLTDVDGLLDEDDRVVPLVDDLEAARALVRHDDAVGPGTGGMRSKLAAAQLAAHRGVPVVLARSRAGALQRVLRAEPPFTLVVPRGMPLRSRKHWIAYVLRPKGAVLVDAGAEQALRSRGGSLLPVGVVGVRGAFDVGDAVDLVGPSGRPFARGLARYDVASVATLAGARSDEIEARLGRYGGEEIVHRDDMVMLEAP